MTLSTWLALATICILGAMTPGVSLALVMKHTVGGSRANGVAAAIGHGVGVTLYALATTFGLTLVLTSTPALFHAVAWGGAAYLIWIGIQTILQRGGAMRVDAEGRTATAWQAARDGLAVSALNPKLAIFFIALFSQFVRPGLGAQARTLMAATAGGIDMGWYSLMALLLSRTTVLAWLRARVILLNQVTGAVLVLLGVRVLML